MNRRTETDKPLWFFGYGSLIWRPDFPFIARKSARINGYVRRFWQGSPDHRGTPEKLGRVLTLVPDQTGYCDGIAFKVAQSEREAVVNLLDHRESGGYTRIITPVDIGHIIQAVVYVADQTNPHYLGPANLDQMAKQILRSRGPSGPNLEYLTELSRSLNQWQIEDAHIQDLLDRCLALKDTQSIFEQG